MATLQSDKVHTALETKLGCEVDTTKRDHNWYFVNDGQTVLASTKISKGSKHTLDDSMVSKMGKQLKLGGGGNFAKFVVCTLSKDGALALIRASVAAASPPAQK
jgi:hypothetical protein